MEFGQAVGETGETIADDSRACVALMEGVFSGTPVPGLGDSVAGLLLGVVLVVITNSEVEFTLATALAWSKMDDDMGPDRLLLVGELAIESADGGPSVADIRLLPLPPP
jgi:hypothetical protein